MRRLHPHKFNVRCVDWKSARHEVRSVREKVFVFEFRISPQKEFDTHDFQAHHVLITDEGKCPVATGRLEPDGEIGHIAVLIGHRRCGLGKQVLARLLELARDQQLAKVRICCPLEVSEFYHGLGFEDDGPVFMRDGIAHRYMTGALHQLHPELLRP